MTTNWANNAPQKPLMPWTTAEITMATKLTTRVGTNAPRNKSDSLLG
jgi:hypothetical protein